MRTKEELLGTENISKLMLSMAVPSIIAQMINILYSIIDRIYIGHIPDIGTNALIGIGVTFPILTLISAFSAFVGNGGAPLSSIALGRGDRERAEKILGNGIFLLIVFTVVLMGVFYGFQTPILYKFGASKDTIQYASSYINIYLAGTIFVELSLGLNTYIIAQGQSMIAMASILVGAVINIVLDPIFIFVLDMDVQGAALATVISQACSALWVVSFLTGKRSTLKIRGKYLIPEWKTVGSIFALGISPFVMRSTESLISVVLNRGLLHYGGDLYVGSMTVMQSVMQLLSAPLAGFTQGVAPIISYNYGARKYNRVRTTYRRMIGISLLVSFVGTATVMIWPQMYAQMFTKETALIELVQQKMPVFMCGMLFFGIQMGIQPTFLALGQAKLSLFIAMLRKVILLVPLAIILPHWLGVDGIYIAEPVSDIISVLTASGLFYFHINKILSKENEVM